MIIQEGEEGDAFYIIESGSGKRAGTSSEAKTSTWRRSSRMTFSVKLHCL